MTATGTTDRGGAAGAPGTFAPGPARRRWAG